MDFRTAIAPLKDHNVSIGHLTPVLFLGSCFSDNVGNRMADRLFRVSVNPFGQLYNPLSIAGATRRLAIGKPLDSGCLVESGGVWHSYFHHTRFSDADPERLLARINEIDRQARNFVSEAAVAVLTFGTTRCYVHNLLGVTVANCHKQPPSTFKTVSLTAGEVTGACLEAVENLRQLNPSIKVIVTVSPIRHLADGLIENSLSKATLRCGLAEACRRLPDVIYFPAYEILIDDLRDYRFYAADMTHPSEVAADYVFEIFSESFFDPKTIEIAKQSLKFVKYLRHRPLTAVADPARSGRISLYRQRLVDVCPELGPTIDDLLLEQE